MPSPALRLTVAFLAMFFLIVIGVSAANQAAPDHFTAQSATDTGFLDCPLAESASGHSHCPSPTYATVETYQQSSPLVPTCGNSIWADAVATHNTTPSHLRLFRPPKPFRAHV